MRRIIEISRKATDHFSYLPFLGVAAVVSFLKLLAYARWLDVAEFGLLAKLLVLSSVLSMVGSMGFNILAHRRVPALLARDEELAAVAEMAQATVASLFVVGAIGCVLLLMAFAGKLSGSGLWLIALIHGFLNHVFVIVTIESKSRLQMLRYSLSVLWRTVVAVGLGVVAAQQWGTARGVLIAETVGTLVVLLLVLRSLFHHATAISWTSFYGSIRGAGHRLIPGVPHWRKAFVVLLATTVSVISINIDRWFAVGAMDVSEFGIYAFAWIIMTGAQSTQNIINAGFFPVVARAVAGRGARYGFKLTALGVVGVIVAGVAGGGVAVVLAPSLIETYYPEYSAAIVAIPLFVISAVLRLSDFWTSFLVISEEESRMLAFETAAIVVTTFTWVMWITAANPGNVLLRFSVLALSLAVASYLSNFLLSCHHVARTR